MTLDAKKLLKAAGIVIFFILLAGYGFYRSQDLLLGVKIKDVKMERESGGVLEVAGNARNAVRLVLNGREISIDQSGNFSETLALLPGYNVMEITARDKFGNTDEKNYQLIY